MASKAKRIVIPVNKDIGMSIMQRATKLAIPRKPYRHFWRSNFDKLLAIGLFLTLILASFIAYGINPEHPMVDKSIEYSLAFLAIIVWMLKGKWTDPETGEGSKAPKDEQ
jgi:hypothetical protein